MRPSNTCLMADLAVADIPVELSVFDHQKALRLCREQGLSYTAVGHHLGRSEATISNWLQGRSDVPSTMLAALALLLGLHPGELFRPVGPGDMIDVQSTVRIRTVPRRKRQLVRK